MNKNSIIKKVQIAIIIPLFLQACLFILTISDSGIMTALRYNSLDNFKDKGNDKHAYIEDKMFQNGGNINKDLNDINSYILNTLERKGLSTNELNSNYDISKDILSSTSKYMMNIAKENYTTDIFLIFDTIEESHATSELVEKYGIYIKNSNPLSNLKDGSDLYIERGPVDIANNLKINTNSNWKEKYTLNKNDYNSEFFYKPINEAKKQSDIYVRDFGYWGSPSIITNDDTKVITYSIPLINREGVPYGILGIGLDSNYISRFFESDELNKLDGYAFLIENSKNEFNLADISAIDKTNEGLLEKYKSKNIKINKVIEDVYELENEEDINDVTYVYKKRLDLYNFNNKFSDEKWEIVLFLKDNNLFYQIDKFENSLKISILISTIVGIITALLLARKLTRSTITLAEKVRQSDPRGPLNLEKIGISEIDDLSLAITNLSIRVADESSKLNKIINLLNMPFGAFKYKKGESSVYCTNRLFHILGIEGIHESYEYVDLDSFNLIIEEATKNKYENEEDVYIIKNNNHDDRLIKLIIQEEEVGIFGVITDVTQEILEKIKIEYDRDHDFLTGLLNRRALRRICKDKIEKDNIKFAAFITLDLDNIKFVNDNYGHDYGDKYIKEAASIMREFEKYNGLVGRISGDEFLVFIYGYESKSEILDIVKEVHDKMKNTIFNFPYYNYNKIKIRSSIGISWYPENSCDYDTLVKYSDFAMYKAKSTFKGSIVEFDKDEYDKKLFLINNKKELDKLIDEELVYYLFHPIVDTRTGKIYAYEMLMRSQIENLNSPYKILDIAAAESRLYEIERITWFKSLETVEKYSKQLDDTKIFINSLSNYLLCDKDLNDLKDKYDKQFNNLVVELLENEQHDSDHILEKIKQIEMCRAQIAIDDFGSGYNNESILLEITPNFIKIDMEIIRDIHKDLNRQDIIKNVISYSSKRGIKVIAEGIETRDELEKLIELGVDYVQGYYISRPKAKPPNIDKNLVEEILDINKNTRLLYN